MIEIIKDIDLISDINKYDVILIGTNTYHTMGNGFQRKVRLKYPETYALNITTKYGDKKKIGTRITTKTSPKFSLCFITNGYNFRPDLNNVYLDYESLEKCIKTANIEFSGLNIATTFIGCSKYDGNGDKNKVLEILRSNSDRINLFIYDYEQLDRDAEVSIEYLSIVRNENYDRKTKYEMLKQIPDDNSTIENNEKRMKRIKNEIKDLLKK